MPKYLAGLSLRIGHALLALALAASALSLGATPPAYAQPVTQGVSNCAPDGQQASGAVYRICLPPPGLWNGSLVVYAHGYVRFNEPIAIPEDQLSFPGGPSIPELINGLGYAFATTSYSVNGLAVKPGLADILDVVSIFTAQHGAPRFVYLAGPSEGGLITVLGVEGNPGVFDGGLAACGPIGDFRQQINYWGDVRVLFDYFFPGVIPGSPSAIPAAVIDQWDAVYRPAAAAAMQAKPFALAQLLRVARVPFDPFHPDTGVDAVLSALDYNIFATNDGIAKLGGQPFDNSQRLYRGSANDERLNREVQRFQADPAALAEMNAHYETRGNIRVPVVTLHTLADPVVPYWHESLYRQKTNLQGAGALHLNIPTVHYGHCAFAVEEVLVAFVVLVFRVEGVIPLNAERVLANETSRQRYQELAQMYGVMR
jgi:hypothetical protein